MFDLGYPVQTLQQEHKERLKRLEQERLARQVAGGSTFSAFVRHQLGNLLIRAGNRLQAYAGASRHPMERAGSTAAR